MAETIGVFVSHHHSPEEDVFTTRLVADLEAATADALLWLKLNGTRWAACVLYTLCWHSVRQARKV